MRQIGVAAAAMAMVGATGWGIHPAIPADWGRKPHLGELERVAMFGSRKGGKRKKR